VNQKVIFGIGIVKCKKCVDDIEQIAKAGWEIEYE
jgi:hypothetical protein